MKTATLPNRSSTRRSSESISSKANPDVFRINNVLVPIDFSPPSMAAVELALPLPKRCGANLHLVHVFEPDYPLASMKAMPLIVPELEVGKRVRHHLKDVAKKYSIELPGENIHAIKGRPF